MKDKSNTANKIGKAIRKIAPIIACIILGIQMIGLYACFYCFVVYVIADSADDGKENEKILEDFRALGSADDVCMINDDYCIYYGEEKIEAADILPKNVESISISVYNGKLYVSGVEETGLSKFRFCIYRFDFNGENLTEFYAEATSYHPWAVRNTEALYFYYKEDSLWILKRFDFATATVAEVERGEKKNAGNYYNLPSFKVYNSGGTNFYIEDASGAAYSIDETVLKNSADGQTLLKYDYTAIRYSFVNGRIFLAYKIPNAFWTGDDNVVLYEYDPAINSVDFCLITTVYDDLHLIISTIG